MSQLKLLQSANPILFSAEEYDRYPTTHVELKQYLEAPHAPERPATIIDYLDSILFCEEDNEIDLKKKLSVEYALYKASGLASSVASLEELQNWCTQISNGDGRNVDQETKEKLYSSLLAGLQSVSIENVSALALMSANLGRNGDDYDRSLSSSRHLQQSQMEELTSYLISSSLQKGIDLKPIEKQQPLPDDMNFLKQCIDDLISKCEAKEQVVRVQSPVKSSSELELALKDLQLAHSFLTKKFEGDRNEYIHNIERLSKTNKELSNELQSFQSQISDLKENCKNLEDQRKKLKDELSQSSFVTPRAQSSADVSFPMSPTSDMSSPSGSGRPYSLAIMRAEFKKILSETQKKYERELQEERQTRKQLEKELASRQY